MRIRKKYCIAIAGAQSKETIEKGINHFHASSGEHLSYTQYLKHLGYLLILKVCLKSWLNLLNFFLGY